MPDNGQSMRICLHRGPLPLCICFILALINPDLFAQRVAPFTSVSGGRGYPHLTRPVPYEKVQTRFEYIDSTCAFLQLKKTGWSYTAYFEITDSLQELGLRIISPLPDLLSPHKGDVTTSSFDEKPFNDKTGFHAEWYLFKATNNSGELNFAELKDMTPEKLKDRTHPEFRIVDNGDSLRLPPGIYKLILLSRDRNKPAGSFAIQFGSIPRIRIPLFFSSSDQLKK
jgi:hypothetical protein